MVNKFLAVGSAQCRPFLYWSQLSKLGGGSFNGLNGLNVLVPGYC